MNLPKLKNIYSIKSHISLSRTVLIFREKVFIKGNINVNNYRKRVLTSPPSKATNHSVFTPGTATSDTDKPARELVGLFFIIKGVGNLILDLLFVCTRAC
jgi:hypothetical protein